MVFIEGMLYVLQIAFIQLISAYIGIKKCNYLDLDYLLLWDVTQKASQRQKISVKIALVTSRLIVSLMSQVCLVTEKAQWPWDIPEDTHEAKAICTKVLCFCIRSLFPSPVPAPWEHKSREEPLQILEWRGGWAL